GAASAGPYKPDYISTVRSGAFARAICGHVSEQRRNSVAMIDDHCSSVAIDEAYRSNGSVGGSDDRCTEGRRDIDASVEGAFTVEWIDALTKRSRHDSFDGPQRRSLNEALPIAHVQRSKMTITGGDSRSGNAGHRGVLENG